jgi:hypothetical protein
VTPTAVYSRFASKEELSYTAGRIAIEELNSNMAPSATVKVLFLLLLGLCHVEDLSAIEASSAAVVARVERIVDALYGASRGAAPRERSIAAEPR